MTGRTLRLLPALLFGGLLGAVLPLSPLWYLVPPLFIVFLAVLVAGGREEDRGFLALCSGELLVALAGAGTAWSVLPLQCLLAMVLLGELDLLGGPGDLPWCGAYILAACGSFALVLLPGNLLVPGAVAVGLLLALRLVLAVGEHEQERYLSGGAP